MAHPAEGDSPELVADAVVKYFYFLCLDESLSFAASLKVLTELKARNWLELAHRPEWVRVLRKWRGQLRRLKPRSKSHARPHTGMMLPMDLDMGVWAAFLSSGVADEIEAVVLSRILGLSDDEIADGLSVTTGTVRYRVGRGLRHLGGYIDA